MTIPNVVVERAPDGWTHIGGPGMHLLIALDEDDERTLVASDHADGGDLDDVIDYLTAGGMRRAHHFVGVHWVPSTRLVAFGPVVATVTLADGSEHEVRPASTRVWTDLELDVAPQRVALRVLDEDERSPQSATGVATGHAEPGGTASEPAVRATPEGTSVALPAYAAPPVEPVAAASEGPSEGPLQTGPSEGGRTWSRDWAVPASAPATVSSPAPPTPSAPPVAPRAATLPTAVPTEASTPATTQATVQAKTEATTHPPTETPMASPSASPTQAPPPGNAPDTAAPSYDHLFGQTTDVAEYRRHLADLEEQADHDEPAEAPDPIPAHPQRASQPSQDLVAPPTGPAPSVSAEVPPALPAGDDPAGHGPRVPPPTGSGSAPTSSGLISSVPWARPSGDVPSPTSTPDPTDPASTRSAATQTQAGPIPAPAPAPAAPTSGPSPDSSGQGWGAATPPAPGGIRTPAPAPSLAPSIPAQTQPAHEADERDDDGGADRTVDRSALLNARDAARQQVGSGPRVLAVLCEQGHASPPHDERCRVCGAAIPRQEPFAIPRPPLGVLRLSTGDVVALDRSVLLGRAPRSTEELAGTDRPHLVKVPSPERDVSRNHLEVLLDGWHVLVRDLGTTNGTTVALPGQQPVRIRANDRQVLEPGSVVSMADEVSFTFEVSP